MTGITCSCTRIGISIHSYCSSVWDSPWHAVGSYEIDLKWTGSLVTEGKGLVISEMGMPCSVFSSDTSEVCDIMWLFSALGTPSHVSDSHPLSHPKAVALLASFQMKRGHLQCGIIDRVTDLGSELRKGNVVWTWPRGLWLWSQAPSKVKRTT